MFWPVAGASVACGLASYSTLVMVFSVWPRLSWQRCRSDMVALQELLMYNVDDLGDVISALRRVRRQCDPLHHCPRGLLALSPRCFQLAAGVSRWCSAGTAACCLHSGQERTVRLGMISRPWVSCSGVLLCQRGTCRPCSCMCDRT